MGSGRRLRTPQGPYEVVIHDLTHEGNGVGHQGGKAIFVPDALPGERVSYLSVFRRRDFDQGRLIEILEPSPQRVTPRCPHFGVCGGCSLQHLEATAQVEFKQRQLLDNLQRIGKVKPDQILPPIVGPHWGYRRRARLSAHYVAKKGGVLVGFREREKPVIAVMGSCDVLDPIFGKRISLMAELLSGLEMREHIPQVEVAIGDNGAAMVLRVLQEPGESDRKRLAAFSSSEQVWIWLQQGNDANLRPLLPNTPELSYRLPAQGIDIRFAPNDFTQANPVVNAAMVDQALEWLDLKPEDEVLELFSGLGNFTLPIARKVARVVAVEGEPILVERAKSNAILNDIANVEYRVADLTNPDPGVGWLSRRYSKALLDPPRSGAKEILPALAATRPKRLLYVSCHPGTLARDAGQLVHEYGYRLLAAGIMDMFPHTSHVESMAVFATK